MIEINLNHLLRKFLDKNNILYTANILIVKNTTFRYVLFPMYFQCIFSTHEMLEVNGCIKCNETTALNTSFTCKRKIQ